MKKLVCFAFCLVFSLCLVIAEGDLKPQKDPGPPSDATGGSGSTAIYRKSRERCPRPRNDRFQYDCDDEGSSQCLVQNCP